MGETPQSGTSGWKISAIAPGTGIAQSLAELDNGSVDAVETERKIGTMKALKLTIGSMITLALLAGFAIVTVRARSEDPFDAAATYKAKCVACHGATADKKFDATKADTDLVQAVLKGKKMEKPPNMPGYEDKGITEDQAKALVDYMKSLKQ